MRPLIELARRGFRSVGVDIRKVQPPSAPADERAAIFKSLVALRYGLEACGHADDESRFLDFCSGHLRKSRSQLFQDILALYETGSKRGGYFVEFGATDGVDISNTVLLEREYGWSGILAEPARYWHADLRRNRNCAISTECVWHTSGETLLFNEAPDKVLSTIDAMSSQDYHGAAREDGQRYEVKTISLVDLLRRHNAPKVIDFLSVDTEGSEFDILSAFDFERYDVGLIAVEHNYTPARGKLHLLLSSKGYSLKFPGLSKYDSWYVK
jgi:FkbM family methyltransferase